MQEWMAGLCRTETQSGEAPGSSTRPTFSTSIPRVGPVAVAVATEGAHPDGANGADIENAERVGEVSQWVVRMNGRIDRIARYQTSRRAPELPVPPVTEDGSRIRFRPICQRLRRRWSQGERETLGYGGAALGCEVVSAEGSSVSRASVVNEADVIARSCAA